MGGRRDKVKVMLKSIFRVQTWKLILILLPLLFLTATLLRFDHLGMIKLRDQVLVADTSGDEQQLNKSLEELRQYTISHIVVNVIEENGQEKIIFGSGPFYLEQQYIKKAKEELARAEASLEDSGNNPNGNIFKKAAEVCDALGIRYGWNYNQAYFDCMTSELAKYPGLEEIEDYVEASIPPTALYRRDFASPLWYPSWPGFVILICIILVVVIFIRFLIWCILRIALILMKTR